jgi:hypothetical protein
MAEARGNLRAVEIEGISMSEDDQEITDALAAIKQAVDEEREVAKGVSALAMYKNTLQNFLYRAVLGVSGWFMQQISGIDSIACKLRSMYHR